MALRLLQSVKAFPRLSALAQVRCMTGGPGDGAGKGGGAGGSIREAGGSFGKAEHAREEQYFRELQAKQLAALKSSINDEVSYHEKEIQEHIEAIERHKKKMKELEDIKE